MIVCVSTGKSFKSKSRKSALKPYLNNHVRAITLSIIVHTFPLLTFARQVLGLDLPDVQLCRKCEAWCIRVRGYWQMRAAGRAELKKELAHKVLFEDVDGVELEYVKAREH